MRDEDKPPSPPLVLLRGDDPIVCYLLGWEQLEHDGSWWAFVTWPRERAGRPYKHVANVRAQSLQPLEPADEYRGVPRRVRTRGGVVRPWAPPRQDPPPAASRPASGKADSGRAREQ